MLRSALPSAVLNPHQFSVDDCQQSCRLTQRLQPLRCLHPVVYLLVSRIEVLFTFAAIYSVSPRLGIKCFALTTNHGG